MPLFDPASRVSTSSPQAVAVCPAVQSETQLAAVFCGNVGLSLTPVSPRSSEEGKIAVSRSLFRGKSFADVAPGAQDHERTGASKTRKTDRGYTHP